MSESDNSTSNNSDTQRVAASGAESEQVRSEEAAVDRELAALLDEADRLRRANARLRSARTRTRHAATALRPLLDASLALRRLEPHKADLAPAARRLAALQRQLSDVEPRVRALGQLDPASAAAAAFADSAEPKQMQTLVDQL